MRSEDPRDIQTSLIAVVADAAAIFGGFILATWIRFESNWFKVPFGTPSDVYQAYAGGAVVAALVFVLVFRSLGLYVRPQLGTFGDKIPRLVRAASLGIVLFTALAFIVKNLFFSFSSGVIMIGFCTVCVLLMVERFVLFSVEIHSARHTPARHGVLILGTGSVAAHLNKAIAHEPRLRSRVAGFLRTDSPDTDAGIPPEMIKGSINDLAPLIETGGDITQVILTDPRVNYDRMVEILLFCEKNLINFRLVPDLFRMLTDNVDVQVIDDVPLLGVGRWPLDFVWNRVAKRLEDIVGAVIGLLLSAPVIGLAAILIRRESQGPVFYRQERCGRRGGVFTLCKLRTMAANAEAETGPVWASENDPRRTKVGAVLRRLNIDELPQFWNVLTGDMSLVGPRPERPHFVEQFKEDIMRYMSRHASKPGMTGWAQVNGLRGNTSITERVKYDLFYLENWSLAFDFKILMRTLLAKENAY